MTKERSGSEKYQDEIEGIKQKLLYSWDEVQEEVKYQSKVSIIFTGVICFIIGSLFILVLATVLPSFFKN